MYPSLLTATTSVSSDASDIVCIAWIDGSALTRECMTHSVASAQRLFLIVPFESAYDFIKTSERKIDLIVYHSHETNASSLADIAALREAFASTKLVVLSDAVDLEPAIVRDLLTQGASGFILTSQTGLQMIVSALAMVAAGGTFVPREILFHQDNTRQPMSNEPKRKVGQFTPREVEVLALLKHGKPNKLIAYELNLSESTVKVHIRNTMRKMGSTNRTHAAMNADRHMEARAA